MCNFNNLLQFLYVIAVITVCSVNGGKSKSRKQARQLRVSGKCKPKSMAEYNLTFVGDWSATDFPKMYPRYRPPAQWSKLIGRTHGSSYTMWRMGSFATQAVKAFAEKVDTSGFDQDAQAYRDVFDAFTATSINHGMGRSSVNVWADGLHRKVSFMVKIVPSPDWFVGLSGLDLCERGRWRKRIEVDLHPIDAGTEQGLTFSSPAWPSDPAERIYQITPTHPGHAAGSFYYPQKDRLTRIGHVVLTKVSEYKLKGKRMIFPFHEPNVVITRENEDGSRENEIDVNNINSDRPVIPSRNEISAISIIEQKLSSEVKDELDQCKVSEWGSWSACSQTCGTGRQLRSRTITQRAAGSLSPCPALWEERQCIGRRRTCTGEWTHFEFLKRRG